MMNKGYIVCLLLFAMIMIGCHDEKNNQTSSQEKPDTFLFGADLSYVNQILDHGGVYKDRQEVRNPYRIFKDHGTELVRLRLWNNPSWTKEVYGSSGQQLYNDLYDVEKAIRSSKEQGMQVLLDFHFSDSWADPGKQEIPMRWQSIKDISVLKDSVYQFTIKTLRYLDGKGLMPEFVQFGNEINCGMLYTDAAPDFPSCNVCNDNNWQRLGVVINSAIKALKEVSASSEVKTQVILHVADPKNVEWWFDHISQDGKVTDFEIIGFSYYPIWHTTVGLDQVSDVVAKFRTKYDKDIMILETAYPWTKEAKDNYHNIFGNEIPLSGYPYTVQGQRDLLTKLTKELIDGNGYGIVYWEPAWISSEMKDKWGTGSSWENSTFFDFEGNVQPSIDYMLDEY